jgi:death-on-curing protein
VEGNHLTVEDAMDLAQALGFLLGDRGLLASAVERPRTSAFGEDIYPTLELRIGALMHGINRNHPLVDGNKRLSWVCSVAYARLNGFDLLGTQDEIYDMVIEVAEGKADVPQIAEWVYQHLRVHN